MCSMKIKIRRPRSCLAYFLWLLGILLSLVLLNNMYAWAHIFAAHAAAYELAGELGYTPADFLRSRAYTCKRKHHHRLGRVHARACVRHPVGSA